MWGRGYFRVSHYSVNGWLKLTDLQIYLFEFLVHLHKSVFVLRYGYEQFCILILVPGDKTNVKKVCARRRLDGSRCFRFGLRIYNFFGLFPTAKI